jgi:DUF3037 family protein
VSGARSQFLYAILRVVPRIERGECFNAGVVVYCQAREYLAVRTFLDERRLAALASDVSPEAVRAHLDALVRIADGAPDAGAVAALPRAQRFGWLVSPSSTVVQPSAVHSGLCEDPARTLDELFSRLVT